MFGEKPIIGHNFSKVQNGKIVLPKFTFSEKDDEIFILKIKEDFMIIEKNFYLNIIKKYEDKINETPFVEEKIKLMKLVRSFYYHIKKETKCDERHRISLPKGLNNKSFLLEGRSNYLLMTKEV